MKQEHLNLKFITNQKIKDIERIIFRGDDGEIYLLDEASTLTKISLLDTESDSEETD